MDGTEHKILMAIDHDLQGPSTSESIFGYCWNNLLWWVTIDTNLPDCSIQLYYGIRLCGGVGLLIGIMP